MKNPVVLFDGVCNLCNWSVQFIIQRDPAAHFRFAALQSDAGAQLLAGEKLDASYRDSIVLVEEGNVYVASDAALRIARRLQGRWSMLYWLILIPKPVRDLLYNLLARNRYRLFGRQDVCMMPTPERKARFL